MPKTKITQWHKCYNEGWKDLIVPEAFSHPAKMSYGLLKRILSHAKIQGWLEEGDVIIDSFGGIGSTGILGAYEGYQVVCVELEQKFVNLAIQNFKLHENAWQKLDLPLPEILQGDSRQLSQVVEKADCIVSSPPYTQSLQSGCPESKWKLTQQCIRDGKGHASKKLAPSVEVDYGTTEGQLGAMKPGKVDMVVSSPPYAELPLNDNQRKAHIKEYKLAGEDYEKGKGYGQTKGNLGNLKSGDVDAIISSPPWQKQEGSMQSKKFKEGSAKMLSDRNAEGKTKGHYATPAARKRAMDKANQQDYGNSAGQLGQEQGDTFWQAAKIIIQQCHQILKPGGHAIWVVKSFVRKKKIVDFPGDWQRLCESVGFKTVCVHHAMLVKETKHQTLFGDTEVKLKERKSFFRRLAESKGSPRIDYEVVLCMSKE